MAYKLQIGFLAGVMFTIGDLWLIDTLPMQMIKRCNNAAVAVGHAHWESDTNGAAVFTWNAPCQK